MSSNDLHRAVDNASLAAWPAFEEVVQDGWLLRFSQGFSKRCNSVTAREAGNLELGRKIQECDRWYRTRSRPPIFRLTPFSAPAGLDGALEQRGYSVFEPTLVEGLDLTGGGWSRRGAVPDELRFLPLPEWVRTYHALAGAGGDQVAAHEQVLGSIRSPRALAVLTDGDGPMACGLGVLDGGLFGLFDFVTAPDRRRQGLGRRLLEALLAWGRERGAESAYLQVVRTNAPARSLYEGAGFRRLYEYWYRVPPSG